jgi:hypothetical protein
VISIRPYCILQATGWTTRFQFPAGTGNISLHHCIHTGSGAHPASCPSGSRTLSLEVKWLEHEADHSIPFSAEVNSMELYLHSPIHLHGVVLSYAQGQLYLYLNRPINIPYYYYYTAAEIILPRHCNDCIFIIKL